MSGFFYFVATLLQQTFKYNAYINKTKTNKKTQKEVKNYEDN